MKRQETEEEWMARCRTMGLTDQAMEKWHRLLDQENPEEHQSFLEWLGGSSEKNDELRHKLP